MGLAFGVVACCRGLGLFGNGSIGFALQLLASVKEVLKLMEPITHPSPILARRLIAGHEANATIRGHADAVEAVLPEVVKWACQVWAERSDASWILRMAVLCASIVTKIG